nr:MAG TPA: hypothetical protein [Caudoviricetes sp.]
MYITINTNYTKVLEVSKRLISRWFLFGIRRYLSISFTS